jgi:hypothetical protein
MKPSFLIKLLACKPKIIHHIRTRTYLNFPKRSVGSFPNYGSGIIRHQYQCAEVIVQIVIYLLTVKMNISFCQAGAAGIKILGCICAVRQAFGNDVAVKILKR